MIRSTRIVSRLVAAWCVVALTGVNLLAEVKGAPPAAAPEKDKAPMQKSDPKHPRVVLDTTLGKIVLELDAEKAPITTENFLKYVDDKHYDGLIFHRVISNFMIQGGGYTADLKEKPTRAPIRNEWTNGLKNVRGTIAMARTNDPNSATAQFFINVKDNLFLSEPQPGSAGYAVFGKVVEGMDVVDKIKDVKTAPKPPLPPDTPVPVEAVVIKTARRQ